MLSKQNATDLSSKKIKTALRKVAEEGMQSKGIQGIRTVKSLDTSVSAKIITIEFDYKYIAIPKFN